MNKIMPKNTKKYLLLIVLLAVIAAFFATGLHHELTLEGIKARRGEFQLFYTANPLLTLGIFGGIYVLTTALSLPGATVLTLSGAAFFGFWPALIVSSFASTLGATLAFLAARYLLKDWVEQRFSDKMAMINRGIEREGVLYLFALRLTVFVPFWLVNLTMGLTSLKASTFYFVSQLGMLAGTAVYTYAGTQLGEIASVRDILSVELIVAFTLLGIFPLLSKKAVRWLRARKRESHGQI